ncbi:MAG: nitrilase-related carbon-nitrogen hydrolase [Nitrospinaceae bacterium]
MKVGFVQNKPLFGDIRHNLERAVSVLTEETADLFVLPELFTTGYQFSSREEARELAESIPQGPTTQSLISLAANRGTTLVAGIAEWEGDAVYNSAVIVGPNGYLGKYQKAHLFDTEKDVFHPGTTPLQVFDIGPARVGIMICFDWRFPETARTLALLGADIIAHPANLVLKHCPDAMITRCLENRVFAVTADRVGHEERIEGRSLTFMGQSQIVDPDGNLLCRADRSREEIQVLEIDVETARNKSINEKNNLFEDRRVSLYRLE